MWTQMHYVKLGSIAALSVTASPRHLSRRERQAWRLNNLQLIAQTCDLKLGSPSGRAVARRRLRGLLQNTNGFALYFKRDFFYNLSRRGIALRRLLLCDYYLLAAGDALVSHVYDINEKCTAQHGVEEQNYDGLAVLVHFAGGGSVVILVGG